MQVLRVLQACQRSLQLNGEPVQVDVASSRRVMALWLPWIDFGKFRLFRSPVLLCRSASYGWSGHQKLAFFTCNEGLPIGSRCNIGQNVVISRGVGVTVVQYAFIGAGAMVTRDVPDYALVFGNPARPRRWMCACGIHLVFSKVGDEGIASCASCGTNYRKQGQTVTPVDVAGRQKWA